MTKTSIRIDMAIAGVLTLAAYAAFTVFDLFDRWYVVSRTHESWELDEIPGALVGALIGLCWFAFRRWREAEERTAAVERAEKNAATTQRQFLAAIDNIPVGIMFWDRDDRLVVCNKHFRFADPAGKYVLMGQDFEANVRNWIANGVVPGAEKDEEASVRRFVELHEGPDETFELEVRGMIIEIQEHKTPGGGILTISQDISERKWAEKSLRESVLFQRTLMDAIPVPAFYKNFQGEFLGCNAAFADLLGLSKSEIIGKTVHDLQPPEIAAQFEASDHDLIDRGGAQVYETKVRRNDGEWRDLVVSKAIFRTGDNKNGGIVGAWVDVTERQRVEEALRRSETQLRAVLDNSPASIYLKDRDGAFLLFNEAFRRRNAMAGDEALGRNSRDFLPEATAELIAQEERAVIESRQALTFERQLTYGDGTTGTYLATKFPVIDSLGTLIGIGGISTDVTERRQMEEQARRLQAELAHVSRLGTMGELASGFAHELNQPLAAISNYVTGALRRVRAGEEDVKRFVRVLELVAEQSRRASSTISRIRKFIGRERTEKRPICIDYPIRAAVGMIEADLLAADGKLTTDLGSPMPEVLADPVQIQQVVLNLLKNAVEAAREDGPPLEIVVRTRTGDSGTVVVEVEDNGRGMDEAVRHHLFEPFYTTKDTGMGIGLLVCRKIIEDHGGRLKIEHREEGGTVVSFHLPFYDPRADRTDENATQ